MALNGVKGFGRNDGALAWRKRPVGSVEHEAHASVVNVGDFMPPVRFGGKGVTRFFPFVFHIPDRLRRPAGGGVFL